MMFSRETIIMCAAAAAFAAPALFAGSAQAAASWDAFVIRNSNVGDVAPTITKNGEDGVTASIVETGQKAGFGTDYFNGMSLSQVGSVTYDRVDSGTITTSPYINIWVTDGTHYAVVAPHSYTTGGEHPGFGSAEPDIAGNNVNGLNLQGLGFSVYENSAGTDYNWILAGASRPNGSGVLVDSNNNNAVITLADIGNLTVSSGPTSIDNDWPSTGATLNGTGFNILFGEIQGTSVTPVPYQLSNISVSAVPEPSSLAVFVGLGGLALLSRRTRRKIA